MALDPQRAAEIKRLANNSPSVMPTPSFPAFPVPIQEAIQELSLKILKKDLSGQFETWQKSIEDWRKTVLAKEGEVNETN